MSPLLLTLVLTTATTAAAATPSAAYIQRTMKSLEESTAENPAHVRVMFYGQSITSHDARAEQIRAVAAKYNCMLIDLREKWRKYLAANSIAVKDLLRDTVHLTPEGCELYAKLIAEELVQGCANQVHTLTLVPLGGELGISHFVVHAPASPQ